MADNDSIGDRMKLYESASQSHLTRRMPFIIRLDGKAFHTLTRGMDRPWDQHFASAMMETTRILCAEVEGVKIAYWQSDEISLLLTDYDNLNTQAWFDKNVQKMVSVAASIAAVNFTSLIRQKYPDRTACFDARVFAITKEEVCNYFVWRQQDATRNSVQMLGRDHFSHKELHGVNCGQIQEKLFSEKGINWNDIPTWQKRGACAKKNLISSVDPFGNPINKTVWLIDEETPIFTQNREYVELHL